MSSIYPENRLATQLSRLWLRAVTIVVISAALIGAGKDDPKLEEDAGKIAESLVRETYFEGVPWEIAQHLPPRIVEGLILILEDPSKRELHENAILVLGMSGSPRAFDALNKFDQLVPRGPVDHEKYRARVALPYAMGHLARTDQRALAFLLAAVNRESSSLSPTWSYGALSGIQLSRELWRANITGISLSGRAEAMDALWVIRGQVAHTRQRADEMGLLEEALSTCQRMQAEGAESVLGSRPQVMK